MDRWSIYYESNMILLHNFYILSSEEKWDEKKTHTKSKDEKDLKIKIK